MTIVFCPKCKKKVALKDEKKIKIKNREEIMGTCPYCGTKFYIVSKK